MDGELAGGDFRLRVLLFFMLCWPAAHGSAQVDVEQLSVGHWVRLYVAALPDGGLVATAVELRIPGKYEKLLGTVTSVVPNGVQLELLGLGVRLSPGTHWDGVAPKDVLGHRVKVSGYWRGSGLFDAKSIEARDEDPRDRLQGRIDRTTPIDGGVEVSIMGLAVKVPSGTPVVHDREVGDYPRAPERFAESGPDEADDDEVADSLLLGKDIVLGGRLEWRGRRERDADFNRDLSANERLARLRLRLEAEWQPNDDVLVNSRFDFGRRWVNRGSTAAKGRNTNGDVSELYVLWRDPLGLGADLLVGRQDFDEPREWLFDENLDAVRGIWRGAGARVDLSVSTLLADGRRRNRNLTNVLLYVSNDNRKRHLAAWVLDRRRQSGPRDDPIFMGVRALGEWIPENKIWFEWALLRGFDNRGDLSGEGFDLGTTWHPTGLKPFYFTIGYAQGSGDSNPDNGTDGTFRQTGLQDNNSSLGGVTEFRYYGEVLDPELANMSIETLGFGVRPTPKRSIDLILHRYRQQAAVADLKATGLDVKPTGLSRDLGWGWDLVYGSRAFDRWRIEFVLGRLHPGDAFGANNDPAWLTRLQVRYVF